MVRLRDEREPTPWPVRERPEKKMRQRKSKKDKEERISAQRLTLSRTVSPPGQTCFRTHFFLCRDDGRVQDHRPALSSCSSRDFIALLSLYIFLFLKKKREKEERHRGEVKFLEVSAGGWLFCRV